MPNGTVKFFNTTKGFGFISPSDGSPDVFVHISAVERSGLRELNDGDQVTFEVEQDRRSGKSSATNLSVTGSAPAASRKPARSGWGDDPRDSGVRSGGSRPTAGSGRGTVKWFNPSKGFGFIQPEAGGDDIFVHISAVERAGIMDLREGEVLTYDIEMGRSGKPSAVNLRFAETDR